MFRIELDVSYENDIKEVTEFGDKHSCHTKIVEEFGPAGGNPVVEYSSAALYDVLNLIKDYTWGDLEDLEYLSKYITNDNLKDFDAREYF